MPRPRLSDDEPKVLLVRASAELVDGVDELVEAQRQKRRGSVSRADVIRELLGRAVRAHRRRQARGE